MSVESSTNRLTSGQGQRPSYTHTGDWVWMSGAPDHAVRIYQAVRAFVFDKDDNWTIELTDDEIAALTHRSAKAVSRARKACYEYGLLSEQSVSTRSESQPNGRHQVRTVRTLLVHHEPPQDYTGPTNCYAQLRRLRGKHGKDAGQSGSTDSSSQNHQGKQGKPTDPDSASSQVTDEHAGHSEWTHLSELETDVSEAETHLSTPTPSGQGKSGSYLPSYLPSHLPPAPHTDRDTAVESSREEREESTAEETNPASVNQGHLAAAQELLASLPRPWTLGRKLQRDLAPDVAEALDEGWEPDRLVSYLTATPKESVRSYPGLLRWRLDHRPAPPVDDEHADDAGSEPTAPAACPTPEHTNEAAATCKGCLGELRAEHGIRGSIWREYGDTPHEALTLLTQRKEARNAA